jgi:hypothetical protein
LPGKSSKHNYNPLLIARNIHKHKHKVLEKEYHARNIPNNDGEERPMTEEPITSGKIYQKDASTTYPLLLLLATATAKASAAGAESRNPSFFS